MGESRADQIRAEQSEEGRAHKERESQVTHHTRKARAGNT